MPKKGRAAKLFIGSIRLGSHPHEEYGGQHHGEILFRTGLNKLSAGLVKLNKKKTKGKIYWDKDMDYIINGNEKKVGAIKLERAQASDLWSSVASYSNQAMVDSVTGKGVVALPSSATTWDEITMQRVDRPLMTNKNGYHTIKLRINNKEFLHQGTSIKDIDALSDSGKQAFLNTYNEDFNFNHSRMGNFLETDWGLRIDKENSMILASDWQ